MSSLSGFLFDLFGGTCFKTFSFGLVDVLVVKLEAV